MSVLIFAQLRRKCYRLNRPGLAENIAPDGGPGSDIRPFKINCLFCISARIAFTHRRPNFLFLDIELCRVALNAHPGTQRVQEFLLTQGEMQLPKRSVSFQE